MGIMKEHSMYFEEVSKPNTLLGILNYLFNNISVNPSVSMFYSSFDADFLPEMYAIEIAMKSLYEEKLIEFSEEPADKYCKKVNITFKGMWYHWINR